MTKNNKIFISVVTCFLNEEQFLAEAIESVFGQTYADWELILVDDGSTDGSVKIAQEFAERYPGKCYYYDHPGHGNMGLSASRNLGISKAKGDWIALLDADDVWLSGKLDNDVGIILNNPTACLLAEASEYWYDWMPGVWENAIITVGDNLSGIYAPPSLLRLLYPLGKGAAPCPSAVMVRKEAVGEVGGFEEHFRGIYQLYEDQAFFSKIYLEKPVHISPTCHNRYRQREGSLVYEIKKEGNYEAVRKYFLEWFEEYLGKKLLTDNTIKRVLRRAWLPYRKPRLFAVYKMLEGIVNKMKYKN